MNTSNQTTNTTTDPTGYYLSEDQWLTAFGSTWILDTFNCYPYIVAAILGFVLNSFSLAVFQDAEFNIALYKYLSVYCLNNMLICLFGSGNVFFSIKRILPWTNSYYPNAFTNYFYLPVASILNFFGSMVDIFILLDRIGNFNKRVKELTTKWSVYRTCAITFVTCSIFCIPLFLAYCSCSITVKLSATTPFTIWFGGATELSKTLTMTILLFVILAVKELGVLLVQLGLNVVSIVLLKRYLMKKSRLIASPVVAADINTKRDITAATHNDGGNRDLISVMNNTNNNATNVGGAASRIVLKKDPISSADQKATVSSFSFNLVFGL
jgi:hypothetical protein